FAAALIAICTIAYDYSRFENTSGDTISTRYWPVAILKYHTYTLNPFRTDLVQRDGQPVAYAAVFFPNGDWMPRVTWGMAAFTLPVYAVVDWIDLGGEVWTHNRISRVSRWNGVVMATLTVVLLYFLLCRFVIPGVAFASSILFALGTWTWSMGAQGQTSQM